MAVTGSSCASSRRRRTPYASDRGRRVLRIRVAALISRFSSMSAVNSSHWTSTGSGRDWRDKRQVIFYGPPGTGKTYIARELARFFARDRGRVEVVQFHPSYAYEDFVHGFRPTLEGTTAGFRLRPGPLLRLASRAQRDPQHIY